MHKSICTLALLALSVSCITEPKKEAEPFAPAIVLLPQSQQGEQSQQQRQKTGVNKILLKGIDKELLGQVGGPVRSPLLQLTDEEKAATRAAFESCGLKP